MGPYDLTMKRLTSEFAEDYVQFALNRIPSHAEVLEVELEAGGDEEVSTSLRLESSESSSSFSLLSSPFILSFLLSSPLSVTRVTLS